MTRRLLLVHAHPDDETIGSGATMAKYVAEGAQVTLVTCTLGEEGEILVPGLAHLASDQQDGLGAHRQGELAAAMRELGVTDHRILGGPGCFRDSGMIETPPNQRADNFWNADLLVAAGYLVEIIRETRPQVLVTYDDFGGYGHPDHIQAHRVAMYASQLAAIPSFKPELGAAWEIQKIYWTAFPRSVMLAGIEALKASGDESSFATMDPDEMNWACPDEFVTTEIHATPYLDKKMAALRAHETQIDVQGGFFALSNNLGSEAMGTEYFRCVKGVSVADGRETDLFAGIE